MHALILPRPAAAGVLLQSRNPRHDDHESVSSRTSGARVETVQRRPAPATPGAVETTGGCRRGAAATATVARLTRAWVGVDGSRPRAAVRGPTPRTFPPSPGRSEDAPSL